MKKAPKKLAFHTETIRQLQDHELASTHGGTIRTSGASTSTQPVSFTSVLSEPTSSGTSIGHH